jgi:LMBR1 domain-containing protein 1
LIDPHRLVVAPNVAGQFPLLGIIAFAIYSFYLMVCAIKGNFKLGIRFLFWKVSPCSCWCCSLGSLRMFFAFPAFPALFPGIPSTFSVFPGQIYPMEINNTLMNAFLVNTWFMLLVSVPTVQFSAFAFPIYVRYTAIDMLFGVQVRPTATP